jgi:hypothetical protein
MASGKQSQQPHNFRVTRQDGSGNGDPQTLPNCYTKTEQQQQQLPIYIV